MKVTVHYKELVREQSSGLWMDLFKLAFREMECYQSDLMHDAAMLARAEHNSIYIWGWRKTGTCLWKVNTEVERDVIYDTLRVSPNPLFNHRIVEVRCASGPTVHPTGYITDPKAESTDELIEIINDYVSMYGNEYKGG